VGDISTLADPSVVEQLVSEHVRSIAPQPSQGRSANSLR
jgi:hypothetical protein